MATFLEIGRQIVRGERETFPIAQLLGMKMKSLDPGKAVFEMRVEASHHNPMGTMHGGVYCDLADAAMGWAYASTLDDSEAFTTVELKINYLRAVTEATLTAVATVVKGGSSLGYLECEVKDEKGRLVAKAASTCLKLKKKT